MTIYIYEYFLWAGFRATIAMYLYMYVCVCVCVCVYCSSALRPRAYLLCFTCFNSTKVQVLTPEVRARFYVLCFKWTEFGGPRASFANS
jgi:hypothetical protein